MGKIWLVAQLINGFAFKSTDYCNEGIPVIRISNIKGNNTTSEEAVKVPYTFLDEKFLIRRGDMLLAMSGATTGKTGIYNSDEVALQNQRVGNIKEIDERVLYRAYKNCFVLKSSEDILKMAYGGAQPNISGKMIESIAFPLPPIDEQKRIADKIERFLNKINQAKQLIEEAKETFELRRAAILDKAFRGELTAKWREANLEIESAEVFEQRLKKKLKKSSGKVEEILPPHQLPSGWKWVHLKDIADSKSGYAFKSEHFSDVGIQVVRMGNLHKNVLNLNKNPVFLPNDYDNDLLNKFKVNEGDILLSLTGTKYKRDYGYAVRVETVNDTLLLNQRILALTPLDLSDYFYYYLQSPVFRELFFSFETGAVNQGNVSSVSVSSIVFPLPPREEGIEIQRIIGNLISKEKELEQLLDSQESLELITQTILTKAFRGELGTNEINDESVLSQLKDGLLQ